MKMTKQVTPYLFGFFVADPTAVDSNGKLLAYSGIQVAMAPGASYVATNSYIPLESKVMALLSSLSPLIMKAFQDQVTSLTYLVFPVKHGIWRNSAR